MLPGILINLFTYLLPSCSIIYRSINIKSFISALSDTENSDLKTWQREIVQNTGNAIRSMVFKIGLNALPWVISSFHLRQKLLFVLTMHSAPVLFDLDMEIWVQLVPVFVPRD